MTRLSTVVALSPFAAALLLGVWGITHAPDHLPVHWNQSGQPDQWGTPVQALMRPIFVLLLGAGTLLLLERRSDTNRRNGPHFRIAALGFGLLATLMTAGQVFHVEANRMMPIGVGLLFALIGNSLGRAVPNAIVGLRTPWVYLSRRAWYASQRRSGLWLTGSGLILMTSGLLLPSHVLVPWVVPYGLIAGTVALLLALTLMSYLDYSRDPHPAPVENP